MLLKIKNLWNSTIGNQNVIVFLLIAGTAIHNAVFLLKYGCRISEFHNILIISFFYGAFYIILCKFSSLFIPKLFTKAFLIILGCILLFAGIFLLLRVSQTSIVNDRYYMIQVFWEQLLAGINPYNPKPNSFSDTIPGGYPFYFLLAYPAWKIGEIGLLPLVGGLLYLLSVKVIFKKKLQNQIIALIPIFISVSFWYEFPARSTLFFNITICLLYLILLNQQKTWSFKSVLIFGILGGIILSTRTIVFIPIIAFYSFVIKTHHLTARQILNISFINSIVFIIPNLLLWIWHPADFTINNPFVVQLAYGSIFFWIVLLGISALFGVLAKNFAHLLSLCALLLFGSIVGQQIISLKNFGFLECLFYNKVDISYVVMTLPFLGVACGFTFNKKNPELLNPSKNIL